MIKRAVNEGIKSIILGWNGVTVSGVGPAITLLPNMTKTVEICFYYNYSYVK